MECGGGDTHIYNTRLEAPSRVLLPSLLLLSTSTLVGLDLFKRKKLKVWGGTPNGGNSTHKYNI